MIYLSIYVVSAFFRILEIEGSRLLRNAGNNMKSHPVFSQNTTVCVVCLFYRRSAETWIYGLQLYFHFSISDMF
jgi:hypothetical protein